MEVVYSDIRMDIDDIRAIEKVFAHMDLHTKISMDSAEILNNLRRLHFINESVFTLFHENYPTSGGSEVSRLLQFNRFLWHIAGKLSFEQFILVLQHSGYRNVCTILIAERGKAGPDLKQCQRNSYNNVKDINTVDVIPKIVPKHAPPHAECLNRYYIKLKVLVDNNALPNGNRMTLESGITVLDKLLSTCRNAERRQLLVDKRVVLYFLLAQQYVDCNERINILKRLHDAMPHGMDVDRTTFDVIFHSYMAVNWATKGNDKTALEHMAIARVASSTCLPCLPVVVSATGAHYMDSEAYLHLKSTDHLQNASADYENAIRLVNEATEEEKHLWRNAIMLQRVQLLLGIKMNFNVNDTEIRPDENNIKEARNILSRVHQFKAPLQKRRKTILYFCIARLHELDGDIHSAVKYINKSLAENGSFDIAEKRNITDYLDRLQYLQP